MSGCLNILYELNVRSTRLDSYRCPDYGAKVVLNKSSEQEQTKRVSEAEVETANERLDGLSVSGMTQQSL